MRETRPTLGSTATLTPPPVDSSAAVGSRATVPLTTAYRHTHTRAHTHIAQYMTYTQCSHEQHSTEHTHSSCGRHQVRHLDARVSQGKRCTDNRRRKRTCTKQ